MDRVLASLSLEPTATAPDGTPPFDLPSLADLGLPAFPPPPGLPVYRHPSRAALRAYQYLRNVGGMADSGVLLRKALVVRGKLPAGLEPVARAMFAGTRGFQEVSDGMWAVEVEAAAMEDLAEGRFVVFDLETTGGKPPSEKITEIGAVRIADGKVTDTFQTLVNPGKPIPPFVARLTGITDRAVRRAPKIEKVLPRFLEFIEGHILIAHDVFQDLRFIDQEIMTTYGGVLGMPVLDTLTLAKELVDPEIGFSLRKVAEHLGIEAGESHRALDDAKVTAAMFLRFMDRKGQRAWEELLSGYAVRGDGDQRTENGKLGSKAIRQTMARWDGETWV